MKVYHYLAFIFLFTSFFWSGLWVGHKIGAPIARQPSKTSAQPQTVPGYLSLPGESWMQTTLPSALSTATPSPSPIKPEASARRVSHQRNILILGVDDLESPAARLESVWMILYLTDTATITLMPIYPSVSTGDGQAPQEDAYLAANFHLTQEGAPERSFFDVLQGWGMWWSGYVLLDKSALTQIVAWLNPLNQDRRLESVQIILESPNPSEDFNAAYESQTWLVQRLCDSIRQLDQPNALDVSGITALFPSHLRTDLDVSEMIEEWRGMLAQRGGLRCELPFLLANQ